MISAKRASHATKKLQTAKQKTCCGATQRGYTHAVPKLTVTETNCGNSSNGFVRVAPVVRPARKAPMLLTLNDPTCTAKACVSNEAQ